MWRSVALTVILAAVAAGCGLGGGSGAGSTDDAATVASTSAGPPYHSVVVRGTHTFSTDDLALPLTVHCPQSGPGGFGANGSGMVFAVDESGNVRISC